LISILALVVLAYSF